MKQTEVNDEKAILEEGEFSDDELYSIDNRHFRYQRTYYPEYIVIPCVFITQFIILGMLNNVGSIKSHWETQNYKRSIWFEQTGSTCFGFMYISSLLAAFFSSFIGPGVTFTLGCMISSMSLLVVTLYPNDVLLFTFFGVILGTGCSLILFSSLCVIKECFAENISTINGIVACGSCTGTMVQSMFIHKVCHKYGWSLMFTFYSMVVGALGCFGWLMHHVYNRRHFLKTEAIKPMNSGNTFLMALKHVKLIIFSISCSVFCLGYLVVFIYVSSNAISKGVSSSDAHLLIGYFSIGSLIGRLMFGLIANSIGTKRRYLLMYCFFFMGLINICSIWCSGLASFVVYSVILGVLDGGYISLTFPVACDLFRAPPRRLKYSDEYYNSVKSDIENNGVAICYVLQGFAQIIGQIITNAMLKNGFKYDAVYVFSGCCFIGGSLIMAVLRFVK